MGATFSVDPRSVPHSSGDEVWIGVYSPDVIVHVLSRRVFLGGWPAVRQLSNRGCRGNVTQLHDLLQKGTARREIKKKKKSDCRTHHSTTTTRSINNPFTGAWSGSQDLRCRYLAQIIAALTFIYSSNVVILPSRQTSIDAGKSTQMKIGS